VSIVLDILEITCSLEECDVLNLEYDVQQPDQSVDQNDCERQVEALLLREDHHHELQHIREHRAAVLHHLLELQRRGGQQRVVRQGLHLHREDEVQARADCNRGDAEARRQVVARRDDLLQE